MYKSKIAVSLPHLAHSKVGVQRLPTNDHYLVPILVFLKMKCQMKLVKDHSRFFNEKKIFKIIIFFFSEGSIGLLQSAASPVVSWSS